MLVVEYCDKVLISKDIFLDIRIDIDKLIILFIPLFFSVCMEGCFWQTDIVSYGGWVPYIRYMWGSH